MSTLYDNGLDPSLSDTGNDHRLVIDTIPGLVWSAQPDGYIDFLNQRWREYTGLTLAEASGWGWQVAIHPDDLLGLVDYWRSVLASGQPGEAEARLRRFDGAYRWFLFRAVPLYDERGALLKWYGQTTDIEDRKWSEALLAGEKRVLEMSARGRPLPSILDALCRLVEEMSSGVLAMILLLDSNGDRLWNGAAPSLPASFTRLTDGLVIGPTVGSCGTAAYRREPVIVFDIAIDPLWAADRDLPLAHGLRACWSTPIHATDGKVLGTFALYSRQPGYPSSQQHAIIEQITHLAAIAIERERTEAALRQSEERFSHMAAAIPEVIWIRALEPEKVVYASPSFERIWGLPVEALYRNSHFWTDAIHVDDRERVIHTFARWIAGEHVNYDVEYRIVRPDGSPHWIHERGALSFDASGKAHLASGIATDITDRKHAEQRLRRSEAYLAQAQQLSRTGSFGWNVSSGELIWSNETFCILGYDRKTEPTLKHLFDRVHPEDLARVRQMIDDAMRERTGFDLEHRLLMSDGAVKQVHVVARATRVESGEVEFVGAVMDITEQVRSQETTRAAKARFEGILEIAEDAIISVDAKQRIVLFNRGAERVFEYAPAEIIGKSLDLLLPQRFVDAHRRHLESFAQSSRIARVMGQRREVFGLRKDGREFPAEASISKLDLGGEWILTVILRDITQRKQAAEALRASEHLARGQLDALTQTLDALAQESDPDRLLEHVLRTLIEQSGAHSVSVWDRNEDGGGLDLMAVVEDGRFQTRDDAVHPAARRPVLAQDHPIWSEIFRTGQHAVLEDIARTSARMRVGSTPDAVWHTVMDDASSDSAISLPKRHLRALGVRAILFIPMLIAGQVAGIMDIRFQSERSFRREEIELTQALAHQATLAIQLTQLSRQSRQVAVTAERNRMARDIHDTLAQGFTGVIVQLEAAADATSRGLTKEAEAHLGRASDLARESLKEARRSVQALRLPALEEKSLGEVLSDLLQKMTVGAPLQAACILRGAPRALPSEWEENILRIGQEVLTNTLRHAHARHFTVQLAFDPKEIRMELRDDGRGFDPARKHDGFGLLGIRERVESMGGRLNIQSEPGAGAVVSIVLPLPDEAPVSISSHHPGTHRWTKSRC
ncbi:MAG: PAS domain S-box protein [Candidatus Competibacter sp.]|nr:PAS domain S-box protein [Candidatus Competibacter sp.]MDS4076691.1 PAS domain S-box protein [Accumulibacter sp.]